MHRNRLAAETSPYLQQHAANPVDWYPWGEEALGLARRDDKPILLSVGYSACHWCHVMAHESFEDPDTAALMNRLFVNVKVDREERPDLDRIYQIAQQLITQHAGGWPLTMFLSPEDRQPFFGGTYFPRDARHGMPPFREILERAAAYFAAHRAEIRDQSRELAAAFARLDAPPAKGSPARKAGGGLDDTGAFCGTGALDDRPLRRAREALQRSFDGRFGGFGRAPKFPQSGSIGRCLRQWYETAHLATPDLHALYMATLSLTRMAEGGIYDQLGGGFARYSVDDAWCIPHFEKMLYDNARLLWAYAEARLATGDATFGRVARETADWMLRDMRAPEGGFYSSLDADSEGAEGKFYVWTPDEVRALLPPGDYAAVAQRFGLDRPANFDGAWHLQVCSPLESIAPPADPSSPAATVTSAIDAARATLLAARNRRIAPARDEKILTSWNALVIKGLALAGRVLDRDEFTAAATAAVDFIRTTLWRDGRLLATCKDGRAHLPAYLDDYAFLADALLELLQTRWRSSDLRFARELLDVLLDKFEDAAGGFFFTASDHERLIHRSKTFGDDSLPSGNGVAASALCRMGYLLGELRYVDAAERTLRAAWPAMNEHPMSHMSMLDALQDFLTSTRIVIIRGDAAEVRRWARELGVLYSPGSMLLPIPSDAADLPDALADKTPGKVTTAYVCTGMTCSAPVTDRNDLARRFAARLNP